MAENDNEFGTFLTGFIIGGLVGAAVALITAPQSGEQTRTLIRDKSIELKDKASVTAEEARVKAEATLAEARTKAEATLADARAKADELTKQAKERADEMAKRGQEVLEEQKGKIEKVIEPLKEGVKAKKKEEGGDEKPVAEAAG